MPANIPDLAAVHHVAGQFTHNVFDTAHKATVNQGKKQAAARATVAQNTARARDQWAHSATQTVNQGRTAYARGVQTQQKQAASAAKAQASNVKSGRAAPASGAAPRTFAMQPSAASTQAAKTMQQQRNFAHGEALKFQSAQFKVAQQAVNHAHGQAHQEANRRAKNGPATASAPSVPTVSAPTFSSAPEVHTAPPANQPMAPASFSSQFSTHAGSGVRSGTAETDFSNAPEIHSAPAAPRNHGPLGAQFSG